MPHGKVQVTFVRKDRASIKILMGFGKETLLPFCKKLNLESFPLVLR